MNGSPAHGQSAAVWIQCAAVASAAAAAGQIPRPGLCCCAGSTAQQQQKKRLSQPIAAARLILTSSGALPFAATGTFSGFLVLLPSGSGARCAAPRRIPATVRALPGIPRSHTKAPRHRSGGFRRKGTFLNGISHCKRRKAMQTLQRRCGRPQSEQKAGQKGTFPPFAHDCL